MQGATGDDTLYSTVQCLGIVSLLSACDVTTPTVEGELTRQTEDAVRSAAGPWVGLNPSITMRFSLTEAPNGQLQGTGRMRQPNVEGDVPITVSGTYNRPNLSLIFAGMVFDGHDVSGTFGPECTTRSSACMAR